MFGQSLVTLLLVVVTGIISYKGFSNRVLREKYSFHVERIMLNKEYARLISSGFLHIGWMHLILNMVVLLSFGGLLEPSVGTVKFLLLYFVSLIAANLLALLIHKNHGGYTSVGASGAVNGIVFASIALFPDMGIGLFLLPVSVPSWAFGLAYVIFSIYGVKAKWGNSGHAAHLGGALAGMLTAVAFYPEAIEVNYLPILLILVPTISFIFFILYKPSLLLLDGSKQKQTFRSVDHEYNFRKRQEQQNVDAILEKIHRKGMSSLSRKEKEALEQYSKMKK